MSRPSVTARYRIGITGAGSPAGGIVRALLEESGLPVSRIVELGPAKDAGRMAEVAGEIAVVQSPSRETVGDLDYLFLTGSSSDPDARAIAEAEGIAFIELDRDWTALGCAVLTAASKPLPTEAFFALLVPAAEKGREGLEQLWAQAGDALNFRPTSPGVFGGRLAFNLLRDASIETEENRTRVRLETDFPACRVSVRLARATLFHGYGGFARFRYPTEEDAQLAARAIPRAPGVAVGRKAGGATPVEAVESADVLVDPLRPGGMALDAWFSFDGLGLSARAAVAAALSRLS